MRAVFPGRDRRAVPIPAVPGAASSSRPLTAVVIGGGIAGLAAACGLAERGVAVELVEPEEQLGGRVRSWSTQNPAGDVSMSRGFHAFFRQYYNLRKLLARAGDLSEMLRPVDDYPVLSARGDRDSFTAIPRTPPWNFITFVARSPTFSARDLGKVDIDAALSLLDVDFPASYREFDSLSAADFLDRLRFPDRARHLALEVFARSFFADPREFSAGELIAMFHAYFLGSAEGLLFDVPRDAFDASLWRPLGAALARMGVRRTTGRVIGLEQGADSRWIVKHEDGSRSFADGAVMAAGPGASREIIAGSESLGTELWRSRVERVALAPPFAVLRLWFDGHVREDRPAFLGTAEFGQLDNVSVLERFEAGAAEWARAHGGSVVELHAYALRSDQTNSAQSRNDLTSGLREELMRVYPETATLGVVAEELLVERDCPLIGVGPWDDRPEVRTPVPTLALAGDWVRCGLPVALMERAATTGWMAANELLRHWGVEGHALWSVPTRGRHRWPRLMRSLMARSGRQRNRR